MMNKDTSTKIVKLKTSESGFLNLGREGLLFWSYTLSEYTDLSVRLKCFFYITSALCRETNSRIIKIGKETLPKIMKI